MGHLPYHLVQDFVHQQYLSDPVLQPATLRWAPDSVLLVGSLQNASKSRLSAWWKNIRISYILYVPHTLSLHGQVIACLILISHSSAAFPVHHSGGFIWPPVTYLPSPKLTASLPLNMDGWLRWNFQNWGVWFRLFPEAYVMLATFRGRAPLPSGSAAATTVRDSSPASIRKMCGCPNLPKNSGEFQKYLIAGRINSYCWWKTTGYITTWDVS